MKAKRIPGFLFLPLLVAVLLPGFAAAQSAAQGKPKPVTLSGRVSQDGQRIVADQDTQWRVSNTQAVRGHEGQLVTVKCTMDAGQSRIHVLSLQASPGATRSAAILADSAFRR